MSCVIGLDIGTTSTIGMLVRLPDQVLALARRDVTLHTPHPGWAEEEPAQWWANACAITRELLETAGVAAAEVTALGVAGMLPALVLLDEADAVIRPSIQQSDGRCGAEVEELREELDEAAFLAKAGNGVNQQIIAPRLRWLARHEPANFARIATVFGSYDYINWRLTGEKAIEQNWALEAGLVDVGKGAIAPELMALCGLREGAVPRKIASHAVLGAVTREAAAATGLAEGTQVVGGAADMIASALGAGVTRPGDVLVKLGGAVDILTASPRAVPDARLFLDYHLVPGLFMPNGCMSTGGAALNWFVRNFAGGEAEAARAAGLSLHGWLDRLAEAVPPRADGLSVLPYFLGEKTPLHDPRARGVFEGLTLSHGLGHLWRALLEAYAYAIVHHVEVLRDIGHPTTRFVVSDGGAVSDVWLQIIADALQQPLQRLSGHPGSCLGAAWTAAMGAGLAEDWAGIARFTALSGEVMPDPARAEVYRAGYRHFRGLHAGLYSR